jgi:hypothetical protein
MVEVWLMVNSASILEQLLQWVEQNAGNLTYLLIGSILTLLGSWFVESQRRRSERGDKRREKIYAPLYDELNRIEKALTNYDRTGTSVWSEYHRIKSEHILYMIPRKLKQKITRLIETEVEKFDLQLMGLQEKYQKTINADLTHALIPIAAPPDTTVIATSDSSVAYLNGLAIYLARGTFPQGYYRRNLEAAFQAVKARSTITQNSVDELFQHYLGLYQSDEDYKALNKQREQALRLAREIRTEIEKDLEA